MPVLSRLWPRSGSLRCPSLSERFSGFQLRESDRSSADGELFKTTGARGACDVVLYSSDHRRLPSELTVEQWEKVIDAVDQAQC